jgi:hypothetical protein
MVEMLGSRGGTVEKILSQPHKNRPPAPQNRLKEHFIMKATGHGTLEGTAGKLLGRRKTAIQNSDADKFLYFKNFKWINALPVV